MYPRHKPDKEKVEAEKDESIENKSRTEMLKWIKDDENGYEFYKKSGQYDPECIPAYHVSKACMLLNGYDPGYLGECLIIVLGKNAILDQRFSAWKFYNL